MPPAPLQLVTLTGKAVRLEPLRMAHVPALVHVGLAPELWRWIPSPVTNAEEMRAYVELALDEQRRGVSLPFAIVDQAGGEVIGSTRYGNIELAHRRLEIGWTWLTPAFQRGPANTEAKRLLLTHAFETLGMHRVELKTDALNDKSRKAIARIGATQEGIFRRHLITASGRVRGTGYFLVIEPQGAAVKVRLGG